MFVVAIDNMLLRYVLQNTTFFFFKTMFKYLRASEKINNLQSLNTDSDTFPSAGNDTVKSFSDKDTIKSITSLSESILELV